MTNFVKDTKLTQRQTDHLNMAIPIEEIYSMINNPPKKKHQIQMILLVNSMKHSRKKWYKFSTISSRKIEAEGSLPISFYEASITLIPKPEKDIAKENYRPVSLRKIETKSSKKKLVTQKQQCINKIIHYKYIIYLGFIPGMQDWFNIWKSINDIHHNRLRRKIIWSYQLMQKKHLTKFNTHSW